LAAWRVQYPQVLNLPKPVEAEVTQTSTDDTGKTDQRAENPLKVVKDEEESASDESEVKEELPRTLVDNEEVITLE
jgi:hypothetical protein